MSHETITFDDRDPPWINSQVKHLINKKNAIYKNYLKNNKSNLSFETFQSFRGQLSSLIASLKNKYYSKLAKRLLDYSASTKTYWSILKTFLNNKKIPVIPPIFYDNRFITDFKQKAEIFNSHFFKQCTRLINNSTILSQCPQKLNESLHSITFEINDIEKIIKNLDPNKSHGHDMLSIRMLKLCGESIYKPLNLIFKSCLETGQFPSDWKKANVVPVFKKGDKQLLKNYRPISLLPIIGNIFERLLYNQMFEFFIRNDLISRNPSGFKPSDSCINQLLAITHEIYKSFDACLDVRAVFLDISKAFDKVWHQGLLYKLKQNGISGNLLETLTDFLKDRKQRVVLNGQNSSLANIEAGVPQGSILGPLLFLIYINDLPDNLSTNVKLFADDTSLFSVVHDIATSSCDLNYDLNRVREWAFQWKMSFNPEPSKQAQEVIFTRKLQKTDYPHYILMAGP